LEPLSDQIVKLVEQNLADPAHFLVDVVLKGSGGNQKVLILVDGDSGISIDACATLSRKISEEMESLIDGKFILEVSSPGVDYPLSTVRQYRKNIGRKLKVTGEDEKVTKGRLIAVSDDGITLARESKKGKKKTEGEQEIHFSDIKKTTVLIEF
jgi:ribosome maturation factor RimP